MTTARSCTCEIRTKLVGDGCEVCNPEKALEYAKETIAELRLQLTASEKDAARYQWLREQMHIAGAAIVEVLQPAGDWGNSVTAESPEGLDAAIDAAMEKANG